MDLASVPFSFLLHEHNSPRKNDPPFHLEIYLDSSDEEQNLQLFHQNPSFLKRELQFLLCRAYFRHRETNSTIIALVTKMVTEWHWFYAKFHAAIKCITKILPTESKKHFLAYLQNSICVRRGGRKRMVDGSKIIASEQNPIFQGAITPQISTQVKTCRSRTLHSSSGWQHLTHSAIIFGGIFDSLAPKRSPYC